MLFSTFSPVSKIPDHIKIMMLFLFRKLKTIQEPFHVAVFYLQLVDQWHAMREAYVHCPAVD